MLARSLQPVPIQTPVVRIDFREFLVAGLPFSGGDNAGEEAVPAPAGGQAEAPDLGMETEKQSRKEKKQAKKDAKARSKQSKYGAFNPDDVNKSRGLGGFLATGGGKLVIFAAILGLLAAGGVYLYTTDRSVQVQQVVVNKSIPPKTVVTRDDIKVIEAPASAVVDPTLLMTLDQIDTNQWMTFSSLEPGVILYDGTLVPFSRAGISLPPGQQLVSITVEPGNAAGGSIAAGDVVDIYIASDGEGPANIMRSVEVVDVLIAVKSIKAGAADDPAAADEPGANSPALKGGIGSVYKLIVDPEQAGIIADAVGQGRTFFLALIDGSGSVDGIATPEGEIEVTPAPEGEVAPELPTVDPNEPSSDPFLPDLVEQPEPVDPIIPDENQGTDTESDATTDVVEEDVVAEEEENLAPEEPADSDEEEEADAVDTRG